MIETSRFAPDGYDPRDVTVVVVTYNSRHVVGDCLRSLEGVGRAVVVDNASADETAAVALRALPSAEVIHQETNRGFARACNRGLIEVTTPWVLFLNPDASLKPGTLRALLDAARQFPDAAVLAPALENAHGVVLPTHDASSFRRRPRGQPSVAEGPCCVEFLLGAVLLIRTAPLRAIGGFDEGVFLFYEDDDVCWRMRQAGHSVLLLPQVRAVHLYGYSSGRASDLSILKAWHMSWSRLYMLEKHRGRSVMRVEALQRVVYYSVRALVAALSLRWGAYRVSSAQIGGLWAYLSGVNCFARTAA